MDKMTQHTDTAAGRYPLLATIGSPADVKRLTATQLPQLCGEIRTALLEKLSAHGGHVAPNLGMVEMTVALHRVFSSPEDKFVFDVSHQSYAHKMLTGRRDAFIHPEAYDDVTGYTDPAESAHDHFNIGHTSTSVSLACGLAKGRDLTGGRENVIAIIGDGSLSGGEALEGLNVAGELDTNLIIVVNDNQMSIAENHGGLYAGLEALRRSGGTAGDNLFRAMGLDYRYVADGNDVEALTQAFEAVKDTPRPVVVHVCTVKGKGYGHAETEKEKFHWCCPFDIATGALKSGGNGGEDYTSLTTEWLLEEMQRDPRVVALTAGTPAAIGFTPERRRRAGRQLVDVGIAEEHAVAMASGLAARGARPVFGVVSSFLQRAYDQLSQDLCINRNAAVFPVFFGSLLGMNDVTHLGFFDIPLLANIPNMVYLAPTSKREYMAMLQWAVRQEEHPVAIKVPGGAMVEGDADVETDYSRLDRYKTVRRGSRVAILALGAFFGLGEAVAARLERDHGFTPTLINPRYITGLDHATLDGLLADHDVVVTLEDGQLDGGWGEKIARHYGPTPMRTLCYGARKEFVDRYDYAELLRANRLTDEQIAEDVVRLL